MNIEYEILNGDGDIIHTVTGSKLREHFGLDPTNSIFTEQLVRKFNTKKEFSGQPERMRQTITYRSEL